MRSVLLVALAALAGCPGASPREVFDRDVAPVLERRCLGGACHGVAPGAEAGGEVIDREFFFVDVDARGRIVDLDAAYANAKGRINTVERPELSSLLRKPLALAEGGVPHAGGHSLGRGDADWGTLRDWIASEAGGGEGTSPDELTALERQFADTVLPVLRDRGCMLSRCHGPQQFAGLPLAPPMGLEPLDPDAGPAAGPAAGARDDTSVADVRASLHAARANLALTADPARSRLLVKALPLDAGGIAHRGGNDGFFPRVDGRDPRDDPGARAIVAWAEAERAALGFGAPEVRGVVFVRGPAAPRALLDLDAFRPGSDVWFYPSLAPGATPVNLTAAAHPDGPADVRDPAVSHDGTRVAFAMRRAADDCHAIWEVGLDGAGARPLTSPPCAPGARRADRWPVWGPGGALYFASNRAGVADETGRRLDTDLYRLATDGAVTRMTVTPTPEATPTFLATGEFRGSLAFTTVRADVDGPGGDRGSVFRFPPDHDRTAHLQPEYHPHHGQTAPAPVVWSLRELPDGRDLAILTTTGAAWEAGQLALVERQFGPDLGGADPSGLSVPGFLPAWTVLTPDVALAGASAGGLWRDPAPLPDGRVVAARIAAPTAVDDASAAPDSALVLAEVLDAPGGVTLGAPVVLWDSPGEADDQPAIVVARPAEDDDHADAWHDGATGWLRHSGAIANAAIARRLAPVGARPLPTEAVTARLVTWPAWAPEDRVVDPAQIANGDPASTWFSNGAHLPLAVLDEVPLAADGSLWAELPARLPVRLQLVDADGFAVEAPARLWIHVQGGERFPQGTQPALYPRLCAGCHGALDGDPDHALGTPEPDAITTASVTLAAYEGRNPRRPRDPVVVGVGGAKDFDFGRDLAPSLARSCALDGCHAGAAPAGGLDLTPTPTAYYDAAYEALQAFGAGSTGGKRYVDERGASARGSYLIERLLGRELDAPRALDGVCPPPGSGAPPLDPDVVAALIRWIDLGAVYRAPAVALPAEAP